MARMLQALKNLEARSSRATAETPVAAVAKSATGGNIAVVEEVAEEVVVDENVATVENVGEVGVEAVAAVDASAEKEPPSVMVAVEEALSATDAALAAEQEAESVETYQSPVVTICEIPAAPWPAWPPGEVSFGIQARAETAVRPATLFERQVLRMLSDPVRGEPLAQLAERIRRDLEQTDSKTVVLVGVGPSSATHEALLCAAMRLSQQGSEPRLLVDADLARVTLSEALDYGRKAGLAELVRGEERAREYCQPTSARNLSFLPAGQLRHDDLSTAGSRLEIVLKMLAAEYTGVFIDGGRTGELTATALARLADATYLVVQLGSVETSEAQAALRDFRAAGARVLGCIAT